MCADMDQNTLKIHYTSIRVQRPNSWTKEIHTKVLRVFLLAIHRHHYFYFFKLRKPLKVSTVQLLYTVKEKEGKSDRKAFSFHPIKNGKCV
jgi:hypothetical protein